MCGECIDKKEDDGYLEVNSLNDSKEKLQRERKEKFKELQSVHEVLLETATALSDKAGVARIPSLERKKPSDAAQYTLLVDICDELLSDIEKLDNSCVSEYDPKNSLLPETNAAERPSFGEFEASEKGKVAFRNFWQFESDYNAALGACDELIRRALEQQTHQVGLFLVQAKVLARGLVRLTEAARGKPGGAQHKAQHKAQHEGALKFQSFIKETCEKPCPPCGATTIASRYSKCSNDDDEPNKTEVDGLWQDSANKLDEPLLDLEVWEKSVLKLFDAGKKLSEYADKVTQDSDEHNGTRMKNVEKDDGKGASDASLERQVQLRNKVKAAVETREKWQKLLKLGHAGCAGDGVVDATAADQKSIGAFKCMSDVAALIKKRASSIAIVSEEANHATNLLLRTQVKLCEIFEFTDQKTSEQCDDEIVKLNHSAIAWVYKAHDQRRQDRTKVKNLGIFSVTRDVDADSGRLRSLLNKDASFRGFIELSSNLFERINQLLQMCPKLGDLPEGYSQAHREWDDLGKRYADQLDRFKGVKGVAPRTLQVTDDLHKVTRDVIARAETIKAECDREVNRLLKVRGRGTVHPTISKLFTDGIMKELDDSKSLVCAMALIAKALPKASNVEVNSRLCELSSFDEVCKLFTGRKEAMYVCEECPKKPRYYCHDHFVDESRHSSDHYNACHTEEHHEGAVLEISDRKLHFCDDSDCEDPDYENELAESLIERRTRLVEASRPASLPAFSTVRSDGTDWGEVKHHLEQVAHSAKRYESRREILSTECVKMINRIEIKPKTNRLGQVELALESEEVADRSLKKYTGKQIAERVQASSRLKGLEVVPEELASRLKGLKEVPAELASGVVYALELEVAKVSDTNPFPPIADIVSMYAFVLYPCA